MQQELALAFFRICWGVAHAQFTSASLTDLIAGAIKQVLHRLKDDEKAMDPSNRSQLLWMLMLTSDDIFFQLPHQTKVSSHILSPLAVGAALNDS